MHRTPLACLALLVAACGSSSSTKPTGPAKPLVWKDMDLKAREQYMKDVVLPKTKEIFVAFDPKFSTMDCVTCHGDGVADGSYEMPNAKIKPLPNSEELFMAWLAKEPEMGRWAQFMGGKVEPLMGELLNETVFDPKTKTGEFGCTNCHQLVDASGAIVPVPKHDEHHDHQH